MSFQVRFRNALSAALQPEFFNWQVLAMDWQLPGGANTAVVQASAKGFDSTQLESFLEMWINSPLEIISPLAEPVWNGWVEKIVFQSGYFRITFSLQEVFNRYQVRYPRAGLEASPFDRWEYTEWQEDAGSVARFGAKEKLITITQADSYMAQQALAGAFAATPHFPLLEVETQAERSAPMLTVTARGWWHKLDWLLDGETRGRIVHLGGGKSKVELGQNSSNARLAQSFTVDQDCFNLTHLWLRVSVIGEPLDQMQVAVHENDAGSPGLLIAQADHPKTELGGGWSWSRWELPAPAGLANGGLYWLVLNRSGALSGTAYYVLDSDDGRGYTGGELRRWNGSEWLPLGQDLRFGLIATENAAMLMQEMAGRPEFAPVLDGFVNWQANIGQAYRWRDIEMTCKQRMQSWIQAAPFMSAVVDEGRNMQIIPIPRSPLTPIKLSTNHAPFAVGEATLSGGNGLLGRPLDIDLPAGEIPLIIQSIRWRAGEGYSMKFFS